MSLHSYRANRFNLFPQQGIEPSYLATETHGSYLFIFLAGSSAYNRMCTLNHSQEAAGPLSFSFPGFFNKYM